MLSKYFITDRLPGFVAPIYDVGLNTNIITTQKNQVISTKTTKSYITVNCEFTDINLMISHAFKLAKKHKNEIEFEWNENIITQNEINWLGEKTVIQVEDPEYLGLVVVKPIFATTYCINCIGHSYGLIMFSNAIQFISLKAF